MKSIAKQIIEGDSQIAEVIKAELRKLEQRLIDAQGKLSETAVALAALEGGEDFLYNTRWAEHFKSQFKLYIKPEFRAFMDALHAIKGVEREVKETARELNISIPFPPYDNFIPISEAYFGNDAAEPAAV